MAFGDVVQSNGGTGAASSTFSATLGSAITAGNLVVLMVTANNVPSGANTGWTKSTGMSPVANSQGLLWWFIGTAGQAIPSVTFAGASTYAWRVVEYAGPFDASPYNTSNGAATNGTMTAPATVTTTAITPTAGSDYLLVGGLGVQYGNASGNVAGITLGSFTNSFVNPTQQFRQASVEAHIACQVSRVVTAASGSYSTAGNASVVGTSGADCRLGLTIAFKKGAASGSVSMPAATGTLTAAGQTVVPRVSLPVTQGTLTLSGQAVATRFAHRTVAGLGTLTLAGQTAIVRYARKMPAGQGTLTPSGQNVTLRYSRKMPAGLGTITVLEPVVNLIYSGAGSKLLPAGLGFPRLDGQPVTVRYARRMPAVQGILALGGEDAGLIYTQRAGYLLTAACSVISLTGCDVTMPITRRPPTIVQENLKFGRSVYVSRW